MTLNPRPPSASRERVGSARRVGHGQRELAPVALELGGDLGDGRRRLAPDEVVERRVDSLHDRRERLDDLRRVIENRGSAAHFEQHPGGGIDRGEGLDTGSEPDDVHHAHAFTGSGVPFAAGAFGALAGRMPAADRASPARVP